MKRAGQLFFCLLLTGIAGVGLRGATPVIGAQLFQDTDAHIEDLFQLRNNPPKPPAPIDDPFRIGDSPLASDLGVDAGPGVTPVTTDESQLRTAASTLVFGGILQIGDVQVLVINKASYKEGGILSVRLMGTPVYLRIVTITPNSVTLGLNEARLTLHF